MEKSETVDKEAILIISWVIHWYWFTLKPKICKILENRRYKLKVTLK